MIMVGRRMVRFVMLAIIVLGVPLTAAAGQLTAHGDRVNVFGDVEIAENWRITGNVLSVFGNVTVYGQVDKNAISIFGTVRVGSNAVVNRNAVAIFGRVITEDGSQIRGNRVSIMGGDGITLSRIGIPFGSVLALDVGRRLAGLVFALVTASLVTVLFPNAVLRVKSGIVNEPLLSAAVGLGAYVVAAPLMLLCLITIIGIPLALLLGLSVWAGRLLGYTAITLLIGERILGDRSRKEQPITAVLVGVLLLAIVTAVPLAGLLVSLSVSLVALGGALVKRFGIEGKAV